jgi:hypothetical protein
MLGGLHEAWTGEGGVAREGCDEAEDPGNAESGCSTSGNQISVEQGSERGKHTA